MSRCFLGLGSNQGDSAAILAETATILSRGTRALAFSHLYASAAWGVEDQPDFLNAVIQVEDERHPQELLAWLHEIEEGFGRKRIRKWGPRTLDLDILTYGDWSYRGWRLEIPHQGLLERAFVLEPLLELAPDFRHPITGVSGRAALESLSEEDRQAVRRLGPLVPLPG